MPKVKVALVAHTYRQLPGAMLGSAAATVLVALALRNEPRLGLWLVIQAACHAVNIGLYAAFRRGRIDPTRAFALWLRRLGIWLTALGWGAGVLLWPLGGDPVPALILVFCYGGMSAGAATTMAGDADWFPVFAVTAIVPNLVMPEAEHRWMSGMLVAYIVAMTIVARRNGANLREAMMLRFENADLLAEAVRQRGAAQEVAAAKARFLAAASHDLRQPVQALSLFIDVLSRKTSTGQRRRAMAALVHTAETLRTMLDSLLDLSRLDAGAVRVQERAVELELLLEQAAEALRHQAEAKGMDIKVAGRPAVARADPALLARVVHNLASNAVRHGEKHVLLGMQCHGERCRIIVADRGPGIPHSERSRIFEDLVRLPKASGDSGEGLGLGLSTVRRICTLAGWSLKMHSIPGRGTCFELSVPSQRSPVLDAEPTSPEFERGRDRGALLLVEPDFFVRRALVSWLESAGWRVSIVHDGDEAVARFRELAARGSQPERIVTEYKLPGRHSGATLLSALFDEARTPLCAVLMTGDVSYDRTPSDIGPIRVLHKPVSAATLHRALSGDSSSPNECAPNSGERSMRA